MELLANGPALLGAIVISVALGAWSLGRWQGGLALTDDAAPAALPTGGEAEEAHVQCAAPRGTAGAAPCQNAARTERRTALAAADSLGELHAEITAYRRAQKVFAGPDGQGLCLQPHFEDVRSECRYLGLMGEPTCGVAEQARTACACGTRCAHADPLPPATARREVLRQPSPAASVLTRV
ncbi:MAG: hypothetical protein NBV68_02535 [Erythrobacter sp.]|uniref:hypothetical protein n=1 Tax=Erythrobacter sp. TaxID=1042 RepID=UPI0025F39891|nr:hypothetical protein [Erythrobacter sp.]MCL9998234.1 hypothetical protein [Erythrobacter sp.]